MGNYIESLTDTLIACGYEADTLTDGTPFRVTDQKTEKPSISTDELNHLAYEEKALDDLAQCGAISRHFPELADLIMEAKQGLEDRLTEEGIELGDVF